MLPATLLPTAMSEAASDGVRFGLNGGNGGSAAVLPAGDGMRGIFGRFGRFVLPEGGPELPAEAVPMAGVARYRSAKLLPLQAIDQQTEVSQLTTGLVNARCNSTCNWKQLHDRNCCMTAQPPPTARLMAMHTAAVAQSC